jgi:hypothetical protein
MRRLVLSVSLLVLLSGCASEPVYLPMTPLPGPTTTTSLPANKDPNANLESRLGMVRAQNDLGFSEKKFNPCEYGLSESRQCGANYLTVVQFQLLCRDSEGTIQEVPQTYPIHAPELRWKLAGRTGGTATDARGYGRFTVLGDHTLRGQRLILYKGSKFVSVTVSDLTKIVLPKPWCT